MKVSIGVDPHKVSVAAAAVDENVGELLERASFPQDLEKALGPSNASPSAALGGGERRWPRGRVEPRRGWRPGSRPR